MGRVAYKAKNGAVIGSGGEVHHPTILGLGLGLGGLGGELRVGVKVRARVRVRVS